MILILSSLSCLWCSWYLPKVWNSMCNIALKDISSSSTFTKLNSLLLLCPIILQALQKSSIIGTSACWYWRLVTYKTTLLSKDYTANYQSVPLHLSKVFSKFARKREESVGVVYNSNTLLPDSSSLYTQTFHAGPNLWHRPCIVFELCVKERKKEGKLTK